MNQHNDFFMRMCREAADELASGEGGWRKSNPNVLLLAAFGMLSNHLTSRLVKPLWFFAGSIFTGVVGYLIHLVITGGA